MRERRFIQADVFSSEPGKGNGLAVVIDAEGLSSDQMQAFAAWTNLAETTFLLPPKDARADYRVRIFTPAREMPFAGHPTLGSCAAWSHAGGVPRDPSCVVQECEIGLVDIDMMGAVPAFVAPETRIRPMSADTTASLCDALHIRRDRVLRSVHLENGPSWQLLELCSAKDVLEIDSSLVRWPEYVGLSVIGAHEESRTCDYEVRNLSPSSGMSEDPITGSLNAAIAMWMLSEGRLTKDLAIAQGTQIGRMGRVSVRRSPEDLNRVLVGGHSQIVIDGVVRL